MKKEVPMLTVSEAVEKEAKTMKLSQASIVDSSMIVFITAIKEMNPTGMQAVGNLLNEVINELMQTASLYQMEIKRLSTEVPHQADWEAEWKAISTNLTAYSSVIAYLKALNDKLEIVNYYMDKRVPDCFRQKSN